MSQRFARSARRASAAANPLLLRPDQDGLGAAHVPHAAGLAWGLRLRGERGCAVCYFGDGATSEGAFHEGANFAAVMHAPLVLMAVGRRRAG